jgi:hypothetical protein
MDYLFYNVISMTSSHQDPGPEEDPSRISSSPTVVTVIVGSAMIAVDQMRGGMRSAGAKASSMGMGFVKKVKDRNDETRAGVRAAVTEADRRGRTGIHERRSGASGLVDSTVSAALGWAQVNVVPQLVDGLVPHLISDVVPRVIDGALPEIRARVVPAVIDDLTNDPRVRELILAQSRGVLGQVTEQVRTGTARADDRAEAAAHRVFGQTDKDGNVGKGGQ